MKEMNSSETNPNETDSSLHEKLALFVAALICGYFFVKVLFF
jgi:hypothetical protein